jgi:hypothetical protein
MNMPICVSVFDAHQDSQDAQALGGGFFCGSVFTIGINNKTKIQLWDTRNK